MEYLIRIDLQLLSFFQKLADMLYEWIRMPIKHLAFLCFAGAIGCDVGKHVARYTSSHQIPSLIFGVCFDAIFYFFFSKGFKILDHGQRYNELHLYDFYLIGIRSASIIVSCVMLINAFVVQNLTLSNYATLCLTAYGYFISCKQKPMKKHPLKEFSEKIAKRFEKKNLQPA